MFCTSSENVSRGNFEAPGLRVGGGGGEYVQRWEWEEEERDRSGR